MEQGDSQLLSINKKIRINKHVVILEEEEYTTELLVLNKKKKTENSPEKKVDYNPEIPSDKQTNGHKRSSFCTLTPINDSDEFKNNHLSNSVRIDNKGLIKEPQGSKNYSLSHSAIYNKPVKSNGKSEISKSKPSILINSNRPSLLINNIFQEQDSYSKNKFEDITNKLILQINSMTSPKKLDAPVVNKPQAADNSSKIMNSNKDINLNQPRKSIESVVFNSQTTKNSKTKKSKFFCCLPIF